MATINYNGMDLEVFTPENTTAFNPPIKCVGWNDKNVKVEFELSSALSKDIWLHRFIGKSKDGNPVAFMFCALLPDPPKPRRATNRELARWLAMGNGERIDKNCKYVEGASFSYKLHEQNCEVDECYMVRKWSDTEWHEPTVDYLESDNITAQ